MAYLSGASITFAFNITRSYKLENKNFKESTYTLTKLHCSEFFVKNHFFSFVGFSWYWAISFGSSTIFKILILPFIDSMDIFQRFQAMTCLFLVKILVYLVNFFLQLLVFCTVFLIFWVNPFSPQCFCKRKKKTVNYMKNCLFCRNYFSRKHRCRYSNSIVRFETLYYQYTITML